MKCYKNITFLLSCHTCTIFSHCGSIGKVHGFSQRTAEPYLVLPRSHALIDLLELAVMRAQEFEGLGYRGHGGG